MIYFALSRLINIDILIVGGYLVAYENNLTACISLFRSPPSWQHLFYMKFKMHLGSSIIAKNMFSNEKSRHSNWWFVIIDIAHAAW